MGKGYAPRKASEKNAWRSDPTSSLSDVRDYWEETTHLYLQHGTTFQGGMLSDAEIGDRARANNVYLALRAGIEADDHVLDAGCGVCAPSIDIAQHFPKVRLDAVTVSPFQAKVATGLIVQARVADRVCVHVCDYHDLPFEDDRFDVVFFFESMYSADLAQLATEVHRVMRRGGRLYAKEVYRKPAPLSEEDERSIREFEHLFRYTLRNMSEVADAFAAAGFESVESRDISDAMTTEHFDRAMIDVKFGFPLPTAFGRRHWREAPATPLFFGELRARKSG
jgi:cyclopropane fatty-acyl-phospholipid synthase-like methyltransferase